MEEKGKIEVELDLQSPSAGNIKASFLGQYPMNI